MFAVAVVGACWGDEGKGLVVDALAEPGSIVVRHNGGAQAGHTVMLEHWRRSGDMKMGGRSHVFRHFGAGTLRGCPTFLADTFIVSPMLWHREWNELISNVGVHPVLHVDLNARVTTPYDMLINQVLEKARGDSRHGSCGVGINETVTRSEQYAEAIIQVKHFENPRDLIERLTVVRDRWVPRRLKFFGAVPDANTAAFLAAPNEIQRFADACVAFRRHTMQHTSAHWLREWDRVVFEGAQGLMLDEGHPSFPYVTRSRTGLTNVVRLCEEAGAATLKAIYVTRAYMTRHGAGPFPCHDPDLRYPDDTNVDHPYQGSMRFGPLDLALLASTIRDDRAVAQTKNKRLEIRSTLAMTHLDQVPEKVDVLVDGERRQIERHLLPHEAAMRAGCENAVASFGPCREDIAPWPF